MVEKKGTILEIIYYNESNSYTIGVAEGENGTFTIVGYLPEADAGRTFLFTGDWKTHKTFGEQFAFQEYREVMPDTEEGIKAFLSSGLLKGIGPKTAENIVNKFGLKTLDVILEEPYRLTEIDGIGPAKAEAVEASFRAHKEFAEITMYFHTLGVNASYAMKLYKVYGADVIEVVKENPYRLADEVFGIGFKTADSIADRMGIQPDSDYRIASGIKYVLTLTVGEGHTHLPKEILIQRTAALLGVSSEQIDDVIRSLVFDGDIYLEVLEAQQVIYLAAYYLAEKKVCGDLMRLHNSEVKAMESDVDELVTMVERSLSITLAEDQKRAIVGAVKEGVCVITGGPGTGKTTIINTIIRVFEHSGLRTAIAAPTGRAAKRITETSGYHASTIHRLLEYYYSENESEMRFGKTAEDPLDYDVIIIDEASMVDLLLMKALLNAIKPGSRLIIVGDADQLPSVGAGNVLRDILDSEIIPSYQLTEIFRQAKESLIVVNAHRINRGEYPEYNEKEKDFFLIRKQDEMVIEDTIRDLCVKRLPEYYKNSNPVTDIQVLTPVKKGRLGSFQLNKVLQQALNPPRSALDEKDFHGRTFRIGDKVMQVRNNYQLEWKRSDDFTTGEGVFNGDIGFIKNIDLDAGIVTVVYDDIKYVEYEFSQMDEIDLAYALTVHKSQGSEFPIIIMPVSWFPPMLATRNLLYTAVTRASKVVVLVGAEKMIWGMVDNNRIEERYSGLAARLRAFLESGGEGEPFEDIFEDQIFLS